MIRFMKEEIKKLFTVKETCSYLRISPPTLYRMLEREELIPVKIGKHTLFEKKDLDSFIDASKKSLKETATPPAKKTRSPRKKAADKKGPAKEKAARKVVEKPVPEKTVPWKGEQGELL
jgi:excisionase family DNA binding protein